MPRVYLSLGSNQQPEQHLRAALEALRERFGAIEVSAAYRTPAVGFDGPAFVNLAVALDTGLVAGELDAWLHALEDRQGRRRDVPRFSSRTLDLDIVFYGDEVIEGPGHLQVPRDELKHAFVLRPLAELAPAFRHPVTGVSLGALWDAHPARGDVLEVVTL